MAAKKKQAKKKADPHANQVIKVSPEEKAARAAIVRAQVLGVAQSATQVAARSKGAFRQRQLRQAGTNLLGYDQGRYAPTYAPAPPTPSTGGNTGGGTGGSTAAPRHRNPNRTTANHVRDYTPKQQTQKQNKLSDQRDSYMQQLAKRRAAERKRNAAKAAADAAAKRARAIGKQRAAAAAARRRKLTNPFGSSSQPPTVGPGYTYGHN